MAWMKSNCVTVLLAAIFLVSLGNLLLLREMGLWVEVTNDSCTVHRKDADDNPQGPTYPIPHVACTALSLSSLSSSAAAAGAQEHRIARRSGVIQPRNRKAIVAFLDITKEHALEELSWLYKTWQLWGLNLEFDLLLYHNTDKPLLPLLSAHGMQDDHLRLRRFPPLPPEDVPVWKDYPYFYSFAMFHSQAERAWVFDHYDYLLRTDCDVFLTENLVGYAPARVLVGTGGVIPERGPARAYVLGRLEKVQAALKLSDHQLMHLGSTVFADAKSVAAISLKQYRITKYLLQTEWQDSPGAWPGWFRGVASMYGMHLAINHIFTHQHIITGQLDEKCWPTVKLSKHVIHIHAWHSEKPFSKFDWFNGEYQQLVLDHVPDNAADYCLWVVSNTLEDLQNVVCEQSKQAAARKTVS